MRVLWGIVLGLVLVGCNPCPDGSCDLPKSKGEMIKLVGEVFETGSWQATCRNTGAYPWMVAIRVERWDGAESTTAPILLKPGQTHVFAGAFTIAMPEEWKVGLATVITHPEVRPANIKLALK